MVADHTKANKKSSQVIQSIRAKATWIDLFLYVSTDFLSMSSVAPPCDTCTCTLSCLTNATVSISLNRSQTFLHNSLIYSLSRIHRGSRSLPHKQLETLDRWLQRAKVWPHTVSPQGGEYKNHRTPTFSSPLHQSRERSGRNRAAAKERRLRTEQVWKELHEDD